MRLGDFIVANVEPILVEWESFARSVWPAGAAPGIAELRDDAEQILRETARDMQTPQTGFEQSEKSQGRSRTAHGGSFHRVSTAHGTGRAISGFALRTVIAEYRALRATVLRLWRASKPEPDDRDLDDLTRFNESMDQSLAEAVESFALENDRARQTLLEAADAANRAKDVFLATLSHEMRTPLNSIVGWVAIMGGGRVDSSAFREGLNVIHRNTKALVQLLDEVLDVSRIVSGQLKIELRPCELIDAIQGGLDVARPSADAKNIAIHLHLDPAASAMSCDSGRIQQVIWNLLANAIKFTPRGGRIDVSLERASTEVVLQVKDTGQGISAESLPQVFERFWQADRSTRRSVSGLGLGLSVVKYIVEAHGGSVSVASPGEGLGSTFTVRLPVLAAAVANDSGPAGVPAVLQPSDDETRPVERLDGLRVLVVDDEADALRVLRLLLEDAGAVVSVAGSAVTALDVLSQSRPDVLISDLGMPGQDGFDLIRQVRERERGDHALPAVALTAFVQADDARRAVEAGFQRHLPKPVDPRVLTSVLAGLREAPQ